jgi:hypothetical protein
MAEITKQKTPIFFFIVIQTLDFFVIIPFCPTIHQLAKKDVRVTSLLKKQKSHEVSGLFRKRPSWPAFLVDWRLKPLVNF